MLVDFSYFEVGENHDKDKEIIYAEGFFHDVCCQDIDFAISYISKYELGVLICSQNLELALLSNFAEEDPGVLLQNMEGKWYPADVAIHLNLAAICYKMADNGLPLTKPSNSKVANKYLKFVQEVVD